MKIFPCRVAPLRSHHLNCPPTRGGGTHRLGHGRRHLVHQTLLSVAALKSTASPKRSFRSKDNASDSVEPYANHNSLSEGVRIRGIQVNQREPREPKEAKGTKGSQGNQRGPREPKGAKGTKGSQGNQRKPREPQEPRESTGAKGTAKVTKGSQENQREPREPKGAKGTKTSMLWPTQLTWISFLTTLRETPTVVKFRN